MAARLCLDWGKWCIIAYVVSKTSVFNYTVDYSTITQTEFNLIPVTNFSSV